MTGLSDFTPWYESSAFVAAISAFTASIISVSITSYGNARVKKIEYINLYYGKLIEKRLAAYEHLEEAINYFRNPVTDPNDNFRSVSGAMHDGYTSFKKGFDLWLKVIDHLHWYSEETVSEIKVMLDLLEVFMLEVTAKPQSQWDHLTRERGKDIHQKFMMCHAKVFSSLVDDYFSLYDIKRFNNGGFLSRIKNIFTKEEQPRVLSEQLRKEELLRKLWAGRSLE